MNAENSADISQDDNEQSGAADTAPKAKSKGRRAAKNKKSKQSARSFAPSTVQSGIDEMAERLDPGMTLRMLHVAYGVIAVSLVLQTVLPSILGVTLTYICSRNKKARWLQHHQSWLWRTYWVGLAIALVILFLGALVDSAIVWALLHIFIIPLYVWVGLRCIRGWLHLYRHEAVSSEDSWFW